MGGDGIMSESLYKSGPRHIWHFTIDPDGARCLACGHEVKGSQNVPSADVVPCVAKWGPEDLRGRDRTKWVRP